MRFWIFSSLLLVVIFGLACHQEPQPPAPSNERFSVLVNNHLSAVETQCAVFLSDEEGRVRAFQWLLPQDTVRLEVSDAQSDEPFDCTVLRMTTVVAPGSGVRDTTVRLITYTRVPQGAEVHVRDELLLPTARYTDLSFRLRDVLTLDSIVVPNGIPFEVPQPDNGFQGQYRIFHTGACWLRLKVNGEAQWRYWLFDQVQTPTWSAETSVGDLPVLPGSAQNIALPFFTSWTYQLERVLDLSAQRFLPLGPTLPVPGGIVPLFEAIEAYEPPNVAGQGYRLQLSGFDFGPGGYGFHCDKFFQALPASIAAPTVDVSPTILADNRLVAAIPTAGSAMMRFVRRGAPNLTWEVLTRPTPNRPVVYRLPDVPAALGQIFPTLEGYAFGGQVEVQVEHYEALSSYEEVLSRYLSADDPLWQMKAGFTARTRIF